jgi:hypothetical protein
MRDVAGIHLRWRWPLADVLDRVLGKGIVIAYDNDQLVRGLRVIEHAHTVTTESSTLMKMNAPRPDETEGSPALISAAEEFARRLPSGNAPHLM